MEKKDKKEKRSIDKKKIIQGVVIIAIIAAMILSVAASLIYSLIITLNQ